MSSLRTSDKKILEKLFRMESGYVLNFSDRTMEEFFKEEFKISVYDKKYDSDSRTRSKANRLRSIWEKEDDKTVGMTILALVDYAENESLTSDTRTIPFEIEKELLNKARDIGTGLLFSELSADYRPEVQQLKNKAQLIKDFNAFSFTSLKTNAKIYLLKVLFSHYEGIIRAYYGSGLFFLNAGIDDLNDYFKILRRRIIELLSSDGTFSEIKNGNAYARLIETITSLYSSAEFLDVAWDDSILPSIVSIREEIADKDLFENNSEIHKMNNVVSNFFVAVSKEIDTLNKFLEQKSKSFHEEGLPKTKKAFEDNFGSEKEKTVKHEHKHEHYFKNSIQEKGIRLNIKNVEDNVIKKPNKKVTLPKFPRTEWSKVSITFLDERNILLSDSKNTKPTSFEGLACEDSRNGKPDASWKFLLELSITNGQTPTLNKKEREKNKKQKQKITDILRKIFDNDTDPFEKEVGGIYKAKFNIKYNIDHSKAPAQKNRFSDSQEFFSEATQPLENE